MATTQEKLNQYWSTHAPAYDENQTSKQEMPGAQEVWSAVWREALPEPPAQVLDVGTGSGNVALLLADLGHDVTGVDLAEGMLAVAREKAAARTSTARFLEGDAVAPPFPPASFDVVTGRYVLWTLREPDRALASWQTLLRPGGRLVLVDSLWYPQGVAASHDGPPDSERDRHFRIAYDSDTVDALPLAEADDIEQMARVIADSGFVDVQVDPLRSVFELDQRNGVSPGHQVQMQYRISARRA